MRKIIGLMVFLMFRSGLSLAETNWVGLSRNLIEPDIQYVMSNMQDPKIIYAASAKRVYRTSDGGNSWSQVLTVQNDGERIRSMVADAINSDIIYLCADHEVYRSIDRGEHWTLCFALPGNGIQTIFCAANEAVRPEILWLGTDRGLIQFDQKTQRMNKVGDVPDTAVYAILLGRPYPDLKLIMTSQGMYRNVKGGTAWEKVFADHESESESEQGPSSQQFGIEEISTTATFPNLVFLSGQNKFLAATRKGILQGTEMASVWAPVGSALLPDKKINFIASSKKTFYAATDRGVFQWDEQSRSFREIYLGLGPNVVRSLDYNVAGDCLLAATKNGVYRCSKPDLNMSLPLNKELKGFDPQDIFKLFSGEPSILEVQDAAIRYAEVSPKKIEDWRKAATRKAWAPTLNLHQDTHKADNIDVDRGGTADPDKFIRGPQDRSYDWYATASWDLGELIWNNDQTSIDSRSKLMVELRNDILNEVTHLYFERRRLQIEMIVAPPQSLKEQLESRIRLEELTSSVDALTGGYFSKRLGEHSNGHQK